MKLELKKGDILLTSGVGGPAAKWKDKLLTWAILGSEAIQQIGFIPTRSHAELITSTSGATFAARWRTRNRVNGLADYIGSEITIGRKLKDISELDFYNAWSKAAMQDFDGDRYPVHRILMQGVSAYVLPFLKKFGFASMAICSEVLSKFFGDGFKMPQFAGGWRGWTPADLERLVKFDRDFFVVFEGRLTEEIMEESGLPMFKTSDDWQ